jgi:hypothetical protein
MEGRRLVLVKPLRLKKTQQVIRTQYATWLLGGITPALSHISLYVSDSGYVSGDSMPALVSEMSSDGNWGLGSDGSSVSSIEHPFVANPMGYSGYTSTSFPRYRPGCLTDSDDSDAKSDELPMYLPDADAFEDVESDGHQSEDSDAKSIFDCSMYFPSKPRGNGGLELGNRVMKRGLMQDAGVPGVIQAPVFFYPNADHSSDTESEYYGSSDYSPYARRDVDADEWPNRFGSSDTTTSGYSS